MRAIVIERNGGPEVLELQDRPTPEPDEHELLVNVKAVGVNFRDVYERAGGYGSYGGPPPRIVGVEGAGSVRAVGGGVGDFKPGDRVGWFAAPGSYAEQVVVPAAQAIPIPDAVGDEQAAAVLLQGMTAHYLCCSTYPVAAGDWVVVHAAAGGVGLLLTQLVKLRGGYVLGTTSSEEKAAVARAAGADEIAGYDGFATRARELTSGVGVAAVYDGVGASTFDAGFDALRHRGTMALYGAASGPVPSVDIARLSAGAFVLTRPSLTYYAATRAELLERANAILKLVADGKLDVRVGGRYPLEHARQAHEDLEGRRTTGKLLLLP